MKKCIFLFSAIIILASCQGERTLHTREPNVSVVNTATLSYQPVSFKNLIRQFRFDPTDIYGDVFSNKAWH